MTRLLWPIPRKLDRKAGVEREDTVAFANFHAKTLRVFRCLLPGPLRGFAQVELAPDDHLGPMLDLATLMRDDLRENPNAYSRLLMGAA